MEEQMAPPSGGVSIPTPPLQSLRVASCTLKEVRAFVEQYHYSHTVNGVTVSDVFKITVADVLKGAAIFGAPAGYGVLKKYSRGATKLTELRRFILAEELPKNSESRVLGYILREMRKRGYARILSYADPAAGHRGIIYKACGFECVGTTAATRKILWNGKSYPRRNLLQVHRPFHKHLQAALDNGDAKYVRIPGKFIYVKDLQ